MMFPSFTFQISQKGLLLSKSYQGPPGKGIREMFSGPRHNKEHRKIEIIPADY